MEEESPNNTDILNAKDTNIANLLDIGNSSSIE
jgi:hypothetical protein